MKWENLKTNDEIMSKNIPKGLQINMMMNSYENDESILLAIIFSHKLSPIKRRKVQTASQLYFKDILTQNPESYVKEVHYIIWDKVPKEVNLANEDELSDLFFESESSGTKYLNAITR